MKRRSLLKSLGLFLGIGPFVKAEPIEQTHDKEIVFCENALEFLKCRDDIVYFVEKYCSTWHDVKLVLTDKLREILKQMVSESHLCVVGSRQCGKSTLIRCYALWKSLFFDDQCIVIVSTNNSLAKNMMRLLRKSYQNILDGIKPLSVSRNENMIRFENGSRIEVISNEMELRGRSFTDVLCDDPAFYEDDLIACLKPHLSNPYSQAKVIMMGNLYYNSGIFYTATQSKLYTQNQLHWRDVYDEEWGANIKNLLKCDDVWNVEFENIPITREKLLDFVF